MKLVFPFSRMVNFHGRVHSDNPGIFLYFFRGDKVCMENFGTPQMSALAFPQRMIRLQINPLDMMKRFRQFSDMEQISFPVIDSQNKRTAKNNCGSRGINAMQIFQNGFGWNARQTRMGIRRCFHIPQPEINIRQQSGNFFRGSIAACFYCRMKTFRSGSPKKSQGKRKMRQRLSAGKGNSASGIFIKKTIRKNLLHHFGNAHDFSGVFQRTRQTDLRAFSAFYTACPFKKMNSVPERMTMLRTRNRASAASSAFFRHEKYFRLKRL